MHVLSRYTCWANDPPNDRHFLPCNAWPACRRWFWALKEVLASRPIKNSRGPTRMFPCFFVFSPLCKLKRILCDLQITLFYCLWNWSALSDQARSNPHVHQDQGYSVLVRLQTKICKINCLTWKQLLKGSRQLVETHYDDLYASLSPNLI